MTILIGVLCRNGVVIGADSSATFSVTPQIRTIEQPFSGKIQIIDNKVLVAGTGNIGLIQRFTGVVQDLWTDKKLAGTHHKRAMGAAETITAAVLDNFRATGLQQADLGALVAFPFGTQYHLFEYTAATQLQPEEKTPTLWYVSLGSGQLIIDSFLALMREVYWHDGPPNYQDAIFTVVWALHHAIKVNPGGINGPKQIALLTRDAKGQPLARQLETTQIEEHLENVQGAIAHLRTYPSMLQGKADAPDVPRLSP